MHDLGSALCSVQEQIAEAAAQSRRSADSVQLVAVTKTHPADIVREAVEAGHLLFGESRVQEAKIKIPLLPVRCRWHFIGHLQKNKIRQALPLFEMIHSVDSAELAREVDRTAAELGLFPRALLQLNVAGEASKFGFAPSALRDVLEELLELPRLQIEGLMTIPPLAEDPEASRPFFQQLRELRDEFVETHGTPLPELSMGMSCDFPVAIQEGATLVRVGTAIFGHRRSRGE